MQSRWVDRDAKAAVDRYAAAGISPDLALRVYTTRLLGGDPTLVLHGGGNTSVKTPHARSRWATRSRCSASRAPAGTWRRSSPPACRRCGSRALQQLRARDELSDEDMVRVQRANLLDPMAPNPSVETLLHAFLPHKFVDHTHANAVLSLVDQPNGAELCEEVYGGAHGLRALRHAGLRARQGRGRGVRARSEGRRASSSTSTASSRSARARAKPTSA